MAEDANLRIEIDNSDAVNDLKKLGREFQGLSGSATRQMGRIERATKGVSREMKSLGAGARDFATGFISLEIAKQMGAFAMETFRSAEAMDDLSQGTKDTAKETLEIVDGTKQIGENIIFWGANISKNTGLLSFFSRHVRQLSDEWALLAGRDVATTRENNALNKQALALSEIAHLSAEIRNAKEQADGKSILGPISGDALVVLNKGIEDTQKKIEELGRKAGLTANEIKLLTEGGTTRDVVGKSDKKPVTVAKETADEVKAIQISALDFLNAQLVQEGALQQKAVDDQIERLKVEENVADAKDKKRLDALIEFHGKKRDLLDDEAKYSTMLAQRESQQLFQRVDMTTGFLNSMGKLYTESEGNDKKRAEKQRTINKGLAIMYGAVGASKAMAQYGFPWGLIPAGASLAFAGAQVMSINNAKMATGGVIEDGNIMGDTVPIMANAGEIIINKPQQKRFMDIVNGSGAVSGGGGGGVTNNYFQPRYSSDTPDSVKQRDFNNFSRQMKTVSDDRNFSRTQANYR